MSHGAIFTRGLFRTRFTFPEKPMVYTYSFPPLEPRLADGSAANHTGVFTPSPFFLNVSNPIASLPPSRRFATAIRCTSFYIRHKHIRQKHKGEPAKVCALRRTGSKLASHQFLLL